MEAGTFIGVLFLARDVAHVEHLKTTSYAAHMATGQFYESVIELADKFAEVYQGLRGERIKVELQASTDSIEDVLNNHIRWINDHRDAICSDSSALSNIVDEVLGLYAKTLFLLTLK